MSDPLPSVQDIDWEDVGLQAAQLLSRYIQIDTSNPPGNEAAGAAFLKETLAAEGIPAVLHEPAPGRANLVARLNAAEAQAAPLLLLHHIDVVPAVPDRWQVPPFDGVVDGGYVWGRGAIDDKGLGTIHLMAFLLLKRLGIPLTRDVIFMAVADEEEGGGQGAAWMVERHWPDIECEYVWDEGGTGSRGIIGSRPAFAISVSEKRSMVVRLTARGRGGHGSMTSSGTPVDRLVTALQRLLSHRTEIRFNSVTREFFRRVARSQPFPASWLMRNATHPAIRPLVTRRVAGNAGVNAMLRDTVAATVLRAGDKANVAPEVAEATLDARLLPDTDGEAFLDELRRAIGDDSISVEATGIPSPTPASPMDAALFRAFERAIEDHVPGAIVTPLQTPVATDSRFFRARGVKAYGLIPAVLTQDELDTIHGVDERISVDNLRLGVRIALDAIIDLCGRP